jgi:cytochrome c2
MKKLLMVIFIVLGTLVLVIAVALVYIKFSLPNVGAAPELSVEQSTENVIHGDYLANHVMVCIDCHSLRDWQYFSGPPIKGTEGIGGERFGRDFGFPGEFYSPNITPYGVGGWTDGELFRAITTGVTRDGSAIFPVMPYADYGKLDESDIRDVIAFIRTLPSVKNEMPEREIDFPFNFILNTIPKKAALTTRPNPMDRVNYGEYMFTAAACTECHTNAVKGKVVGEYLAGGFEFNLPDGSIVRSPNITPHVTGIGLWNESFFINRFKFYTDSAYIPEVVEPGDFMTVMPWIMYGGMTDDDLGSMYQFLKMVPAVENVVERFTVASK